MPAIAVTSAPGFRAAGLDGGDRTGALVLSLALNGGLFAALLLLGTGYEAITKPEQRFTLVDISQPPPPPPPPPDAPRPNPTQAVRITPASPAPRKMPDIAAPAPVMPPIVFPPTVEVPPGEASSGQGSTGTGEASRGSGGGGGTGGTGGGGTGGAARPAEAVVIRGGWVGREPTAIPPPAPLRENSPRSGWATIFCRTAPGDRLVDCIGHQESYPGFAEHLRQASAKFRYRAVDKKGNRVYGRDVQIYMPIREPGRRR